MQKEEAKKSRIIELTEKETNYIDRMMVKDRFGEEETTKTKNNTINGDEWIDLIYKLREPLEDTKEVKLDTNFVQTVGELEKVPESVTTTSEVDTNIEKEVEEYKSIRHDWPDAGTYRELFNEFEDIKKILKPFVLEGERYVSAIERIIKEQKVDTNIEDWKIRFEKVFNCEDTQTKTYNDGTVGTQTVKDRTVVASKSRIFDFIQSLLEQERKKAVLKYILSLGWQDTDNDYVKEVIKDANRIAKDIS